MITQTKIRQVLSLILVILFTGGRSSSFYQAETEIIWNENRKLTWEDFKGNIPLGKEKISAETIAGISISRYEWDGNFGKVKIFSVFNKKKSWVRKNISDFVLKHEQGHFDITEIYARKLRKKLNHKKFKRSTSSKVLQSIVDRVDTEKNICQILYDKESKLSTNREKQKEWDLKIAKELESLEKYKDIEITIILKGK